MRDANCLVIIEVRYRGERSFVTAEQTIDRRKQAKIIRATGLFLAWNQRYATLPVRFDVVGIDADSNGRKTIRWLRDAFRPSDNQL